MSAPATGLLRVACALLAAAVVGCSLPAASRPPASEAHPTGSADPVPLSRAAALAEPQGVVVEVDDDGMTVSWLAVDGATDGYVVTVDGAWHIVSGTAVHLEEYLPGLPYRVEVAAVARGRRGPPAIEIVDPLGERRPPAIMGGAPAPDPPPDAVRPRLPGDTSGGTNSRGPDVGVDIDGCGFAADGTVSLTVTVTVTTDSPTPPALLLDSDGRIYLPGSSSPSTDPLPTAAAARQATFRFAPVPSGPAPEETTIDRVLFLVGPVGQQRGYREHRVVGARWGFGLCDTSIARPRW